MHADLIYDQFYMNDHSYGLIFDVDGVIADTESLSARITAGVFVDLFGIEGVTYEDFNAGRGRGAEAYLRAAAEIHGLQLNAEQVLLAEETRENRILEHMKNEPLPPYPGVLELVDAGLAEPRMRVAIATSSTRIKSQMVLTSTGVPYEKMVYVTGSDVSNKKPHPELFLTAAARIDISPAKCLVIEDAPSGIKAANRAGCKCLAVSNSFPENKLQESFLVVDSLETISIANVIDLIEA